MSSPVLRILLVFLAVGCTANPEAADDEQVCAPGIQVACACPGGQLGAQSCTADQVIVVNLSGRGDKDLDHVRATTRDREAGK